MLEQLKSVLLNHPFVVYGFASAILSIQFMFFDEFQSRMCYWPDIGHLFTVITSVVNDSKEKNIQPYQMVFHFTVELYHKYFLLNYIFTGHWISYPKIYTKTACTVIGVTMFFLLRQRFLKAYNKYLLLRIGIAFGNALAVSSVLMAIVNNTLLKPQRILFIHPVVDFALIVAACALCIPTHKYIESHLGLGKKEVYIGSYKKSFMTWAVPAAIVILLEAFYLSHAKDFVRYTLDEDHPLQVPQKFFTFAINAIWLHFACKNSIILIRQQKVKNIWKRFVGREIHEICKERKCT